MSHQANVYPKGTAEINQILLNMDHRNFLEQDKSYSRKNVLRGDFPIICMEPICCPKGNKGFRKHRSTNQQDKQQVKGKTWSNVTFIPIPEHMHANTGKISLTET